MPRVCPVCYARLPTGVSTCQACPTVLEAPGVRHTVTVLFADLVDSVGFGNSHDAEIVTYVKDMIAERGKDILVSHGGLLNQIVGDELMGLFGYPEPNDDDAIRCVRAARALHVMVRELNDALQGRLLRHALRLHSGCATGKVVIKRSRMENVGGLYSVNGIAVNLAARARETARPDELLCAPETYAAIADYFVCSPPQPVWLKGLEEHPVDLARIEAPTAVQRRFDVAIRRGLTRWVGREQELENLAARLSDSFDGRGHCVVIRGEAGVGKTRLAHQFSGTVPTARLVPVAGYCHADVNAPAFGPLLTALGEALHIDQERDLVDRRQAVEEQLAALDPGLGAYLPHLLMLLKLDSERHRLNAQLPEEVLQAQFQEALSSVFRSLAQRRPLLILLDDWQWADDASRRWLTAMLPTLHEVPLLFVVLTRPDPTLDWTSGANVTVLGLETLTLEQTHAVFSDVVGARELPPGLDRLLHEHTGGNALFIEEVARGMLEHGDLTLAGERAMLSRPLDELQLPPVVESVIQSRIGLLPRAARDVLKAAAVIGRSFDHDVLTRVAPDPGAVADTLADLLARDFIHRVSLDAPVRYRFKHVVTQRATYETLLKLKRIELHRQVAMAIESLRADRLHEHFEALAHHFSEAGQVEQAVTYYGHAAERSSQLYQIPQAMNQYLAAIELIDGAPMSEGLKRQRIEFALALGRRAFIQPTPRVYALLQKSRDLAHELGETWLEAQAALTLGNVSWLESRFDAARLHLRAAMATAAEHRYTTLGAAAEGAYGHTLFYCADFPDGIAHLERAAAHLRGGRNRVLANNVDNYLALQYGFVGRFEDAYALQKAVVAHAVETGHRFIEQATRLWSSLGTALQGRWEDARALTEASLDVGDTTHARYMAAYAHCSRGQARFFLGEARDGLSEFADGLDALYGLGHHLAISMYEAWFAEVCALAGEDARARDYADRALSCAERGEYVGEIAARRALALAEARRAQPNWAYVDEQMTRALDLAPQRWQWPDAAITHFRQAEMLAFRGAEQAARDALAQAAQGFKRLAMDDWWLRGVDWLDRRLKCGYRTATFVPYCGAGMEEHRAPGAPATPGG
ncbi:MAG: AAA family ATPase [Gammaproteobacteria bacterium]